MTHAAPLRATGSQNAQAVALQIVDLRKSFGSSRIIRGVSIAIPRGERHAIIGPNGAGKTTLFGLISGLTQADTGTVHLNGTTISGLPPHVINRRGLARSFQVTNIFAGLTVYENVRCAALWRSGTGYSFARKIADVPGLHARVSQVLGDIGLTGLADVRAGVLTYAEQRALEIGLAIAGDPAVILLDEPTAGMSRHETERAIALISKISENRTLLMVEHDMSVVFGLADRISVMVYGEIIATGTPEEIRGSAEVRRAYLGDAHL